MNATAIHAAHTRIIPASTKAKSISLDAIGNMAVCWSDGTTGIIPSTEKEMQAFVFYTMLNGDTTR